MSARNQKLEAQVKVHLKAISFVYFFSYPWQYKNEEGLSSPWWIIYSFPSRCRHFGSNGHCFVILGPRRNVNDPKSIIFSLKLQKAVLEQQMKLKRQPAPIRVSDLQISRSDGNKDIHAYHGEKVLFFSLMRLRRVLAFSAPRKVY